MTTEERFWAKVERLGPDDCWPWHGSNVRGYGQLYVCGRNVIATRIAWEIHHGLPFPADKDACHSCDNPPCCNPRHIWPGTKSQNAIDSVRKGRQYRPWLHGEITGAPRKTHCKHGHELTAATSRVRPASRGGGRECLTCKRLYGNAARTKRRALAEAPAD